jgi:NNP family nitrate/nitrite transporter-like MFS transporter
LHSTLAGRRSTASPRSPCCFRSPSWFSSLKNLRTSNARPFATTFLPSFYYSQFHVSKIQAGSLTVLATLTGSLTRVAGGYLADRFGGITTLSGVFLIVIVGLLGFLSSPSLAATTLLFMLCFAALGAGNGATFQLVPLRWPLTTAVAGGMIGEIGALGGGILPNLLGQAKQHTGTYSVGFALYSILACGVLVMLRIVSRRWTRSWAGAGGRALNVPTPSVLETLHATTETSVPAMER